MAKDLAALGMTGGPSSNRANPDDLFIVGLDGEGATEEERIDWIKALFPKIAGKLETFRDIRACVVVTDETVRVFRLASAKPVAYESLGLSFPEGCGRWSGKRLIAVNSGRQTTKILRIVNAKLDAQGKEPITVVCVGARYATDLERVEAQMIENARLVRRTPMQRAWSADRCVKAGSPRDDAMVWAEVSTDQGFDNLLALLDCSPSVQAAVDAGPDAGGITQSAALDMLRKSKGDHAIMDAELAKRLDAAKGKTGRARSEAIRGESGEGGKPKPVSPKVIRRAVEHLTTADRTEMKEPTQIDGYVAIIRHMQGDEAAYDALPDDVRRAFVAASKVAKKPRAGRAAEQTAAANDEQKEAA